MSGQWCTYGVITPSFGKVIAEDKTSVEIVYCEGQMYPPESWDPAYVKHFETPEEAIIHMTRVARLTLHETVNQFKSQFGSVGIDITKLLDLWPPRIRKTEGGW